ncbi:acetyl-coenzyme A synthetase [Litoreibacter halocynthiae]|uniref:Acetyl-coenzyme A synthetase n=1 Tax=Litoreibacter halocynthiae TaxID=1242689 RepID=A0A4R7LKM1_9RHOB|nr:acetate--CoA ligase [Litoreibacter halocynthiae]TDT75236.1 acetyl-coenzyme A synthetase [Litoreibacter halocynthiae]
MTTPSNPDTTYAPDPAFAKAAHVDAAGYEKMYAASVADPDAFWAEQGKRLDWIKPFTQVSDVDFTLGNVHINWFADGTLNVAANCIDRHLATRGDQTAIIWEPDDPTKEDAKHITYKQLHKSVCKMANVLETLGVRKGDRVVIYLPMIPEAAYAMLACARIGAIHSIVFAGFSPDALGARINGCDAKVVITADEAPRGGRKTALKSNTDQALLHCKDSVKCLVVKRTGGQTTWTDRDYDYNEMAMEADDTCRPAEMSAEDPLFILYTSGSTGQPKGVVHTSGGYLAYAAMTQEIVFDYHDGDVFWCTADVGWVTGHSYIVYGPLANGATTIMFEGVPTFPDAGRFWDVCQKHKVNQFYTAPTALRALMGQGNSFVEKYDLSDLKVLGTVGEPINPEAWTWYYNVVGKGKVPIVDTWWQTETGGHLMTPLPGATNLKPGSAQQPFFGIKPLVLDPQSAEVIEGNDVDGVLVIANSWPGQMRTVWGDHERFEKTYFSDYPGYYFTGDGCKRDADGDYWITGRVDDVINVSGHRMGTAEVESALVAHAQVAESAVVGYPHDIKGQGIYAYVTLMNGVEPTEELRKELEKWVRTEIGPIAKPDLIQWSPGLPKTRSGKIMRRILRKIAEDDFGALGDTSTLAEPAVVDDLIANRMNRKDA